MNSFWGQGELNSRCLFTITPFWKLTLTNVNIELPCVIIALALEDWPSLRYVITLLRTLFCKQYFFSRTVTLLRYYERFSVNSIFFQLTCYVVTLLRARICKQYFFFSRPVTLLRYYERFPVNRVFFEWNYYVVTLLRALFCKENIFTSRSVRSVSVTLLRALVLLS